MLYWTISDTTETIIFESGSVITSLFLLSTVQLFSLNKERTSYDSVKQRLLNQ